MKAMRSEISAMRAIQAGRRGEDPYILLARAKLVGLAQRKRSVVRLRAAVYVVTALALSNLLRVLVAL